MKWDAEKLQTRPICPNGNQDDSQFGFNFCAEEVAEFKREMNAYYQHEWELASNRMDAKIMKAMTQVKYKHLPLTTENLKLHKKGELGKNI